MTMTHSLPASAEEIRLSENNYLCAEILDYIDSGDK